MNTFETSSNYGVPEAGVSILKLKEQGATALEGLYTKETKATVPLYTAELIGELPEANFAPEQQQMILKILQRTPSEFKGIPTDRTIVDVDTDLQYATKIRAVATIPEQQQFLDALINELQKVVNAHPRYQEYKEKQDDPVAKDLKHLNTVFKGLGSVLLLGTALMDIANKNYAFAALKAGLVMWVMRIDKYIDPALTHVNQVKFLTEERFTNIADTHAIGGNHWHEVATAVFNQGLRTPEAILQSSISNEAKAKFAQLDSYEQTTLLEQLAHAKSRAAQQTTLDWIKGKGIDDV